MASPFGQTAALPLDPPASSATLSTEPVSSRELASALQGAVPPQKPSHSGRPPSGAPPGITPSSSLASASSLPFQLPEEHRPPPVAMGGPTFSQTSPLAQAAELRRRFSQGSGSLPATPPPPSPFGSADEPPGDPEQPPTPGRRTSDLQFSKSLGLEERSLNRMFSGLSGLSQDELTLVCQLTDELELEEAFATLNSVPDGELGDDAALAGALAGPNADKLEETIQKLREVLPPDMAAQLPPLEQLQSSITPDTVQLLADAKTASHLQVASNAGDPMAADLTKQLCAGKEPEAAPLEAR